jgi:hypothetical protein
VSETPFEQLQVKMPQIADAVKLFPDGELQQRAFDALMEQFRASYGGGVPVQRVAVPLAESPASLTVVESVDDDVELAVTGTEGKASAGARKRRTGGRVKKSFSIVKGLNFAPEGKPSLEEFVAEKQPKNQHERNLLACHYLAEMMGIEEISVGHVLAIYQAAKWSAPAHPDTSLQATASAHAWLDTKNMKAIQVMWQGQNQISKMPMGKQA